MSLDTRPRIVHVSRVRQSRCAECNCRVSIDPVRPWGIVTTAGVMCADCAAATPELSDLARILAFVPAGEYPAWASLCIAPSTLRANTQWSGTPIQPRPYEIMGENGCYLSIEA